MKHILMNQKRRKKIDKIIVTDEWLYKYMPIIDVRIINEPENSADYEYQFSDIFIENTEYKMWGTF